MPLLTRSRAYNFYTLCCSPGHFNSPLTLNVLGAYDLTEEYKTGGRGSMAEGNDSSIVSSQYIGVRAKWLATRWPG